ncbi:MAG: tyrosine-protein phosphatase [Clostridium sp.]
MNNIIDIHTHVLPEIDDGSNSIEMTLKMINQGIENGVVEIVATPHYRAEISLLSYKEVENKVEALNNQLRNIGSKIKIYAGQEIYYTDKLIENLEKKEIGTINNSRYILIELSSRKFEETFLDTVYELKLRGITTIIAHPERYKYVQRDFEYINRLIDEGCLFQLDAASLVGDYGKDAKQTAMKILKNNIYNFIGSDSHNDTNRKNCIKESIKEIQKINREFIESAREDSKRLLLDKDIDFRGKKIKRKNIISIFFKS